MREVKSVDCIILTASSGGHLEEIANLDPLETFFEVILLTEKTSCDISSWYDKVYYVPQVNRKELKCVLKLISNAFTSWKVLRCHKPAAVISTGALATIPVCLFAKLKGIKVIYIESFARMDSPSRTGRLMYKIADKTIVQWAAVQKFYPNAIYGGSIF